MDTLKKYFSTGMIILLAFVVGALAMKWFSPSKEIPVDRFVPVRDSNHVKPYITEIEKRDKKIAWYEKILRTKEEAVPVGGFTGMTPSGFMRPVIVMQPGPDSMKYLANYNDFPVAIRLSGDRLTVSTLNPGLRAEGLPSFKQYPFPREADRFDLMLRETHHPDQLDGVRVIWTRPVIEWRGVDGEVGYCLREGPYLAVETSLRLFDLFDVVGRSQASQMDFKAQAGVRFSLIK